MTYLHLVVAIILVPSLVVGQGGMDSWKGCFFSLPTVCLLYRPSRAFFKQIGGKCSPYRLFSCVLTWGVDWRIHERKLGTLFHFGGLLMLVLTIQCAVTLAGPHACIAAARMKASRQCPSLCQQQQILCESCPAHELCHSQGPPSLMGLGLICLVYCLGINLSRILLRD